MALYEQEDLTLAPENSCAGLDQPMTAETAGAEAYQQERVTILVPEASSSELDHSCSKQTAWMRADLGTQPEEAGPQGEL